MRRFLAVLCAAAFLAPAARADWRNFDNEIVPLLQADTWLNTGKATPTAADLRGKVYLLEFFATW